MESNSTLSATSGTVETIYFNLREAVGDDRLFFVGVQTVLPACLFVSLCFLFYWIERLGLFKDRRIVPRDSDPKLTAQAIKETLFGQFIMGPVMSYFVLYHVEMHFNPEKISGPLPSAGTAICQLLTAFVIEDFMMFWSHRILHHPALYKHYHKKHHTFIVTNTFASAFAGGVEAVFSHALSGLMAIWVTRMHLSLTLLYSTILILDTIDGHCNYDIPFSPFTSGRRHNYHHSHNVGTFGLKFGFWDWICGTDKAFKAHLAREAEEKKKKASKK